MLNAQRVLFEQLEATFAKQFEVLGPVAKLH